MSGRLCQRLRRGSHARDPMPDRRLGSLEDLRLARARMPLRAGGHHVAHDTPRWSFVSSAVRKGRSQAASLAPTESPLSALDPVTGDEFKAGRGARLAIQIAGVWTDMAKLDARLAVEFVSVRAATSRRSDTADDFAAVLATAGATDSWRLIAVAAPQAGVGVAGDGFRATSRIRCPAATSTRTARRRARNPLPASR